VLVDTILQLDEVIEFNARIECDPAAAEQQQQQQQSARYISQLLSQASIQQVHAMFCWTAEDLFAVVRESYQQIPILLDLVGRQDQMAGPPPAYMSVAEQQLYLVSTLWCCYCCCGCHDFCYGDCSCSCCGMHGL
jgi:hypothetical protein